MRVGVVLVHYHTPELARSAVEALDDSDLDLEVLIVDNGNTTEGRRLLAGLEGVRLLDPGRNLGYAGAFNLGASELRGADALVVMNPDVRVLPGCLEMLVAELEDGAGVTGPRFWWDRPGGFQLPPTERRSRRESLRRFLAPRLGAERARRSWRRHARRHWLAKEPVPSLELSGALLAISAEAWRHVGAFDDGYTLYFEETDWLERARRAGIDGLYVPAAEALHAYAQSTAKEPQAAAWFEASHRRFRQRHYGRFFTAALERASSFWLEKAAGRAPELGPKQRQQLESADWLEVAASAAGFPAAGLKLEAGERPSLPIGAFWLRALRDDESLFVARLAP